MSVRKPGGALPRGADVLAIRYCRKCKYLSRGRLYPYCDHQGRRYEVALYGGKTPRSRICQGVVDGKVVRWGPRNNYLLMPWPIHETVMSAFTKQVEMLDDDPPLEDEETWFVAEMPWAGAGVDEWDDGRMRWAAYPRHVLSRYREQTRKYKGKPRTTMSKVRQVLADKPCFCWNPRCLDRDRRERWLDEHGDELPEEERAYYEQSPLYDAA